MRLPFLRSRDSSPAAPRSADDVQAARVRAKRRLAGSVILVLAGVIVLPMLFEGQPRPLPVDLPIVIPAKDGGPALAAAPEIRETAQEAGLDKAGKGADAQPAQSAQSAQPSTPTADSAAGKQAAAADAAPAPKDPPKDSPKAEAPAPKPEVKPETKLAKAPDTKLEVKPEPKAEAKHEAKADPKADPRKPEHDERHKDPKASSDSARAQALLEGRDPGASAKDKLPETGRFVVQVGAFGEASSANDVRAKVEKLGLKTYTQEVQSGEGRRIRVRVGPFGSRDEADKAAAKLRAAGMPPSILAL